MVEKGEIRQRIWNLMEEKDIARFPRPVFGRIPNFIGSNKAAEKVRELEEWKRARVIKINPDSPQRKVRELALRDNKILVMPSPKLVESFLVLKNLRGSEKEASTIRGAYKFGRMVSLEEIPEIDLIVAGSVGITLDGKRLGKGGGYADLEYGILREIGKVDEKTTIITTVHEVQIVDDLPRQKQDIPLDYIITPERVIKTNTKYKKPEGVYWDLIPEEKFEKIPLLKGLINRQER